MRECTMRAPDTVSPCPIRSPLPNRTTMPLPDDSRALEKLFNDAHATYLATDGADYPTRIVLAREINIPEGYEPLPNRLDQMRPGFQHERRRFESPTAPPIAVVE